MAGAGDVYTGHALVSPASTLVTGRDSKHFKSSLDIALTTQPRGEGDGKGDGKGRESRGV